MTDKKYSVTRSTTERYAIKNKGMWSWANITISEDGDLNIISDYGNYSYAWRSFGDSFKEFLIRICEKCDGHSRGYLYDKLHNHYEASKVDCEKSVIKYKQELFKIYREKKNDSYYMSKDKKEYPELAERVRDCYECLVELEHEGTMSQDAFMGVLWNDSRISNEFFDGDYIVHEGCEYVGDLDCEAFCREIAPIFAEILKEELYING